MGRAKITKAALFVSFGAASLSACGVHVTGGDGSSTATDPSTRASSSTASSAQPTTTGAGGALGQGGGGGAAPVCKPDGTLCSRREECCTNACSGRFCGPGAGICAPLSAPVALASDETGIYALTIDADFVYFSTPQGEGCGAPAKVWRVPKEGGAPEIVAIASLVPDTLAVDETRLFWPDSATPLCEGAGSLEYALFIGPKAGAAFGTTISTTTHDYAAREIALDDTQAFFIYAPFYVHRADKATGWSMPLGYEENWPESLAIDDTMAYWSCDLGIRRRPKKGKEPAETIAPYDFRLAKIAADATALYVSRPMSGDYVKGIVYRMSKDGVEKTPLATLVGERPGPLTLDDDFVYWTTMTPFSTTTPSVGHVMRAPKVGGEVVTLAEGEYPGALAVDDSCVYWIDGTRVMRGPK